MNEKLVEGLKALRDSLDVVIDSLCSDVNATYGSVSQAVPEVATVGAESSGESVESSVNPESITPELLDGMSYNGIKKLASSMNLSAKGSRNDLISRILEAVGLQTEEVEESEEPDVEDESPDEEVDPTYQKVLDACEGMTNEEIADVLADVGVSAKGKRETLIDKLVKAVNDGLIEFEDEEEDSEEESVPVVTSEVSEDSLEQSSDDNINSEDNPNMTDARYKAILAKDKEIRSYVEKGTLTRYEMEEFLYDFYGEAGGLDEFTDDEVLDTYVDAVCRLIDDDGDSQEGEENAYMLNGEPACCGRHLQYSEDTNMYICEHCGTEYEAE